jgi:PII-like signaling protein
MDTKLGFREEELRNLSKSNPVMMEMLNELKEIKNKLNSLDENKNKSTQ